MQARRKTEHCGLQVQPTKLVLRFRHWGSILKVVRLATRKSPLALWQANHVADLIKAAFPEMKVEILGLSTEGDRNRSVSLAKLGGKGVFVKELELALQSGEADFAVHSMKDVPAVLPDGLALVAMCERADPRDALISRRGETLERLPEGAMVGSSSLRRCLQLAVRYPHLSFDALRGNVETRLKRLDEGAFDAIILATAGLERLGLANRITERITPDDCIPSAGQGAVGLEARADRSELDEVIQAINHPLTFSIVNCERRISERLGATCDLPVAAFGSLQDPMSASTLTLSSFVSNPEGTSQLRVTQAAPLSEAIALGDRVADELIDQGALALVNQGS